MRATLRGPAGLIKLNDEVLTIGRSRQSRLPLAGTQISSKHAEIQPLSDGRYQVIDVGSTNGTWVNGMRLTSGKPYVLRSGDTLRLGSLEGVQLVFEWGPASVLQNGTPPAGLVTAEPVPASSPYVVYEESDLLTSADPGTEEAGFEPLAAPAPLAATPAMVIRGPEAITPPPASPPAWMSAAPQPNGAAFADGWREAPRAPGAAPVPVPNAILTPARRINRVPRLWLMMASALVLVLLVGGIGLGIKVLGKPTQVRQTPPVVVSTATPAPAVIQTATATVQGQPTTILTNTAGMTLYYFTPDTAAATACTGACIAKWPPLLFTGSGTPTASSALPGKLSIQTSTNGAQVAYNLHPLYTFSGDTAPGQTNGEGKAGKWFVATPTLAINGSTPPLIQTASVTVQGQPTTILTTAAGLTLYYFTPDTATTSACTGGCATTWPPLLFSGSGTPTAATSLPGTLSVQQTPNGAQVEYNGHLLYTFSGDTAPGQTNGEGKGGKWFVATPTLAVQS